MKKKAAGVFLRRFSFARGGQKGCLRGARKGRGTGRRACPRLFVCVRQSMCREILRLRERAERFGGAMCARLSVVLFQRVAAFAARGRIFFCGKRMIRAILALHSFYCLRNRCGICEAFGRTGLFRFLLARKARCSRRGARRIFIALLLASGWAVGGRGMIFSCCHAAEDGNGKS